MSAPDNLTDQERRLRDRYEARPLLEEIARSRGAFEKVLREGDIVKVYEIAHEALEERKQ